MADIMTPEQRSRLMSRVRGRDTGLEMKLRKALWATGARYRLNLRLPGRPDICFPGAHVAVFVDGCFWHGCPVHGTWPATNPTFWRNKIENNIRRDRKVDSELRDSGWTVLRFWEHEVKADIPVVVSRVLHATEKGP